jgi:hypothetical protein
MLKTVYFELIDEVLNIPIGKKFNEVTSADLRGRADRQASCEQDETSSCLPGQKERSAFEGADKGKCGYGNP